MKFNGATFNKAQQDQLKKKVGAELDDIIKKVDDVDSRMLNYAGDWVTDNEYQENDVVTWADGHLYEVIKAHTSSSTIDPSNNEYYKAMTATKYVAKTYNSSSKDSLVYAVRKALKDHKRVLYMTNAINRFRQTWLEYSEYKEDLFQGVVAHGFYRDDNTLYPCIITLFTTTEIWALSGTLLNETGCTKTDYSVGSSITLYFEQ